MQPTLFREWGLVLDQCVVLGRPRMLSDVMEWRESLRSVVRAYGVLSELTE